MSTLESYVPLIQAEAERLAQFLDTLSTDDLHLPTFRTSYTALTELMAALRAQAWDTPCAFFPRYGQLPARAFLLLTVQELVIHTWDIRSRFDISVALPAAEPSSGQ